jgi:hypothetical protein
MSFTKPFSHLKEKGLHCICQSQASKSFLYLNSQPYLYVSFFTNNPISLLATPQELFATTQKKPLMFYFYRTTP